MIWKTKLLKIQWITLFTFTAIYFPLFLRKFETNLKPSQKSYQILDKAKNGPLARTHDILHIGAKPFIN